MSQDLKPARVGVFGGTFNPIHLGHLRAAEEIVETLNLDRMIFVPSATPPHKSPDELHIADARTRLAWVEAAVADNPHFEVDALEVEREGPSYSVDTLQVIGARIAPERPAFVIGEDAFLEIDTWHQPAQLFELAHFVVIPRPPAPPGLLTELLPACVRDAVELSADGQTARHRREGTWIRCVTTTPLEISASEIRSRLREGRTVRYLIPEAIHDRVIESGAYASPEPR